MGDVETGAGDSATTVNSKLPSGAFRGSTFVLRLPDHGWPPSVSTRSSSAALPDQTHTTSRGQRESDATRSNVTTMFALATLARIPGANTKSSPSRATTGAGPSHDAGARSHVVDREHESAPTAASSATQ